MKDWKEEFSREFHTPNAGIAWGDMTDVIVFIENLLEFQKSTLRKEIESRKRGSNECWHTAGQICAACEVNTTLDEILNLPTIRSTEEIDQALERVDRQVGRAVKRLGER